MRHPCGGQARRLFRRTEISCPHELHSNFACPAPIDAYGYKEAEVVWKAERHSHSSSMTGARVWRMQDIGYDISVSPSPWIETSRLDYSSLYGAPFEPEDND